MELSRLENSRSMGWLFTSRTSRVTVAILLVDRFSRSVLPGTLATMLPIFSTSLSGPRTVTMEGAAVVLWST